MKGKVSFRIIAPALAISIGLAGSARAQDTASKAPDESAASSTARTEQWAENAYDNAKTAATDSLITLKIKVALMKEKTIGENDVIHVSTNDGIVTLAGKVHSTVAITGAEQIARSTSGVREVSNRLGLTPTGATN